MATIVIDIAKASQTTSDAANLSTALKSLSQQVRDVRGALRYKIAAQEQISARLLQAAEQISQETNGVTALRAGLEQVIASYQQRETANSNRLLASHVHVGDGVGAARTVLANYPAPTRDINPGRATSFTTALTSFLMFLFSGEYFDQLRRRLLQLAAQLAEIHEEQARLAWVKQMLENHTRVDTSRYDRRAYYQASNGQYGYFDVSGGCTWYAFSRYREVNGEENDLRFTTPGNLNANNWANKIDTAYFNKDSTANRSVIKPNTIAVDVDRQYGHVVYVEAVDYATGTVYYSEGSYGSSESAYGYIQTASIDKFASTYEWIISAK